MMQRSLFGICLIMTVALLPMESSAEDWRDTGCVGVVETELEMLEIEALGEPSVTYIVSSRGSVASEGSEELNGWVSFENCKGNLNVQLTESCSVEMMYTSGQCQIPGISHY